VCVGANYALYQSGMQQSFTFDCAEPNGVRHQNVYSGPFTVLWMLFNQCRCRLVSLFWCLR
jgi:hypothetical protein